MRVAAFHRDAGSFDRHLRTAFPDLAFLPTEGEAGFLVRRVCDARGAGIGVLQIIGWDRSGRDFITPLPMDGSDLGFHACRDFHVPADGSGRWFYFVELEDAVGWLLRKGGET